MQILAAGGIPPLTDELRAPDESNPRGYFEFDPVKRLRTDRSWIDQARGHAIKVIHLLLAELPIEPQLRYRVLFLRRPLSEVLASQRVMLERQGKKAADDGMLSKVFQAQLEQAERSLAAQPSFRVLHVQHHALFENPQPTIEQVNEFLGGQLDVSAMKAVIDPALYRQRS
ncbi:MAG: sulfotransferase family protein [Chthoniobacteraceae bacterium]